MSNVRLRRLKADFERLNDYVRRHARLRLIQHDGDPPEKYQLEYQIKSLRMTGGELHIVPSHIVEISLPLTYPRTPPQCRMLSPVFHPNIAPHAICVGDHWGAGESLQSIVARIGEMLAFQSYNVRSPLNGEAARWVEENKGQLPLDRVSLLVEDVVAATTNATAAQSASPSTQPTTMPSVGLDSVDANPPSGASVASASPSADGVLAPVACPSCGAEYRLPPNVMGRKARCKRCSQVFVATPAGPSPDAGRSS